MMLNSSPEVPTACNQQRSTAGGLLICRPRCGGSPLRGSHDQVHGGEQLPPQSGGSALVPRPDETLPFRYPHLCLWVEVSSFEETKVIPSGLVQN